MTDKQQVLDSLEEIFEDTFLDGDYEFSIELGYEDMEEWDSLSQIRLLTAIESEFGFQFDMAQIEDLTSVNALVNAIMEKLEA